MKLDDPAERRHPLWWVLAAVGLTSVLVAGWVIITALTGGAKDDAEPGSPAAEAGTGSGLPAFAADPVFDSYGRVAYVPKNNPHGVALTNSTVSGISGRPVTQKPDGVLLEKVNGDMVLPFSTSDGPTGFTSTGVATGFSHTAQGAALAAIHYMCWFMKPGARTDRLQALVGQGIVDDDQLVRNAIAKPRNGFDLNVECAASKLKVDYNAVLTKVQLAYGVTQKDGSRTNFINVVIVEWRNDHWILKIRAYGPDEPGGYYDPNLTFDPAQGWVSWFAS